MHLGSVIILAFNLWFFPTINYTKVTTVGPHESSSNASQVSRQYLIEKGSHA